VGEGVRHEGEIPSPLRIGGNPFNLGDEILVRGGEFCNILDFGMVVKMWDFNNLI
jgi:hypothetical protein